MSELPVTGVRRLRPRTLLVDYRLLEANGKDFGGGTARIESSNGDSTVKQLNALLSGRRFKITAIVPIT
jgi:hypothetical protein